MLTGSAPRRAARSSLLVATTESVLVANLPLVLPIGVHEALRREGDEPTNHQGMHRSCLLVHEPEMELHGPVLEVPQLRPLGRDLLG